jgi:hypothetical protein
MIRRSIIMILAVSTSGCVTVARGTDDQIQILSDPSGARVTTSLSNSCVTPCTIQVSGKDDFTVVYELTGYERQEIPVKTQIAGTGVAGEMGVDTATGTTLGHIPNPVRAVLVPIPPAKNDVSGRRGAKQSVASAKKKAPRISKPTPVPPPAQQSFNDTDSRRT